VDDIDGEVLLFLKGLENAIREGDADVEIILAEWSKTRPQDASPGMFKGRSAVQEAVDRARASATPAKETTANNVGSPPETATPDPSAAEQSSTEKPSPAGTPEQNSEPTPAQREGASSSLFSGAAEKDKKKK